MSFWGVEEGAITGTISAAHAPGINQYLVWEGGLVDDFELKLLYRLTGSTTGDTNGGFQFRSRRLPHGDVAGYQVDTNFAQPWKVRLYDEFGRHDLALEGEQTVFTREGKKETTPLALEPGARDFKLDEWHEYHLIARGRQLALRINGHLVAQVFDGDDDQAEAAGVLAMQLHTGPPMKAQFKDIRLKRLPMDPPLPPRARLLAEAALHWDFSERLDAHQPPLKAVGQVTAGVPAEGPGAVDGARVTRFGPGALDPEVDLNQPALWNLPPGTGATVFIRLRPAEGDWASTWLSKGTGPDANFRLAGESDAGTSNHSVILNLSAHGATGPHRITAFHVVPPDQRFSWNEWIIRLDGQALETLLNGTPRKRDEVNLQDLRPQPDRFLIGAELVDGTPGRLFRGDIAEIAIWNRALKPEEQLELWSPVNRRAALDYRPPRRVRLPDGK